MMKRQKKVFMNRNGGMTLALTFIIILFFGMITIIMIRTRSCLDRIADKSSKLNEYPPVIYDCNVEIVGCSDTQTMTIKNKGDYPVIAREVRCDFTSERTLKRMRIEPGTRVEVKPEYFRTRAWHIAVLDQSAWAGEEICFLEPKCEVKK